MKRQLLVVLLAFSFGISMGCADGKSNKRARIAAATAQLKSGVQAPQKTPPAETTPPTDTTGTPDNTTTPPPAAKTTDYDSAAAKDIQENISDLIAAGETISLSDLKDMNLDLDEVVLGYTSLEDVDSKKYVAMASLKYDATVGGFKQVDAQATGSAANMILIGLPSLSHIEFAADGSTPNLDAADLQVPQIIPMIKDQTLTLSDKSESLTAPVILEGVFEYLLELKPDADGKIISPATGATINLTQIKKLEGFINISVEVQASANKIQTFILKFKK